MSYSGPALIVKKGLLKRKLALEVRDFTPELASNEVLVEVTYSAINFAELMMTKGLYPDAPGHDFCPGYEFSGKVVATADDVSDFNVGQLVCGASHFGAHSRYVKVESKTLIPIEDCSIIKELCQQDSKDQDKLLAYACAQIVSFSTAYIALIELIRLRGDDILMIDCASGSLGHYLIGLAKEMGLQEEQVIGLTGDEGKLEYLKQKNITAMTIEKWQQSPKLKVSAIVNSRAGQTLNENRSHLTDCGRLLGVGASSLYQRKSFNPLSFVKELISMPKFNTIDLMNANQAIMGLNVLRLFSNNELIRKTLNAMKGTSISPQIDSYFSYKDYEKAFEHLGEAKSKGKVLIHWQ